MIRSYRHNNTCQVISDVADISLDSFADYETVIESNSHVTGESRLASTVLRDSDCHGSTLTDCAIDKSIVIGSHGLTSQVLRSRLTDCTFEKCDLTDVWVRRDNRDGFNQIILQEVRLSGIVCDGDVKLIGPWSLGGNFYINRGSWERAPRTLVVSHNNGVDKVGITESCDGYVNVGQRSHRGVDWLKSGPRLARMAHWDVEQVQRVAAFIEELLDTRISL